MADEIPAWASDEYDPTSREAVERFLTAEAPDPYEERSFEKIDYPQPAPDPYEERPKPAPVARPQPRNDVVERALRLTSDQFQSNARPVVENGQINWGDQEMGGSAADFFRADAARMAMEKNASEPQRAQFERPSGSTGSGHIAAYAPVAVDENQSPVLRAIRGAESSNNPRAQNRRSSAGGLYQFTDGTWGNVLRRMNPQAYGGYSNQQLKGLKFNADLQEPAAQFHLNNDIVPALRKAGIPLTPGNVYLGWFQGPAGAIRAHRAPSDAKVSDVFPETVAANAGTRFRGKPYAQWTMDDLREFTSNAMSRRMRADGGRINGYADGGSANFIPHDDPRRVENLNKFLSRSQVRNGAGDHVVLYHITPKDFGTFKAGGENPERSGLATWLTPHKDQVSAWHNVGGDNGNFKPGTNVMPVHANITSPLILDTPEMLDWARHVYANKSIDFPHYIPPETKAQLVEDGYDGIFFAGFHGKRHGTVPYENIGIGEQPHKDEEIIALHPEKQLKSATGNQGTFDPSELDINKADGGSVDNQPLRDLNASGLYSHAAEMASQLPQERGSPQQMAGMLTNKYGVKPVEMEGFDEAFSGQPSVTRDQLVQHFTSNMPQIERKVLGGSEELYPDSEPTKFSKYALPGGENYREVLLKFPHEKKQRVGVLSTGEIMTEKELAYPIARRTAEKIGLTMEDRMMPTMVPFKSSHYPDPNILVHTRLSDRTGPNNEKILHIEEIQSDWAQKGRKEGFGFAPGEREASEDKMAELALERNALRREGSPESLAKADELQNEIRKLSDLGNKKLDGPPSAPYVTNTAAWTDLALKDILNEAVNGGYDKVVWTPGAEQAKRYSLSQHIDNITWSAEPDGKYWVGATAKDGSPVRGLDNEPMTPKQLEDTFGREVAEKIVKGEGKKVVGGPELELSGLDLQTGGEGMKGYYDKIVPTQLSKLLKKLDPEAKIGRDAIGSGNYEVVLSNGEVIGEYSQRPMANLSASMTPDATVRHSGLELPSITITPKMREALKRGLPAYADGGAVDDEDEGLTAYHGSPHDFEQFDTSKIGTGEGAQAYGHGLYFAESEPVAQEYRDKLTAGTYKGNTGAVFDPFRNLEHMNVRVAAYKSIDNAIDRAKDLLEDEDQSHNADMINRDLAKLMEVKAQNAQPQTGRMYEVRINAHPDHFLDWDAPFEKQHANIQNVVRDYANKKGISDASLKTWRGEQIYENLGGGKKSKETSEMLHNVGIPGIKYFDADSRSYGEGTRNYVVFNHDNVQVKRKYAQGGAIDET